MNKTAIKTFAIEARKKLIASVKDKAGLLGITGEECSKPEQKGVGFEVYRTHAGTEKKIFELEMKQRQSLVNRINEHGYNQVMEEVAYTWFNRIIAIRFMEINAYLPARVRVLSSETKNKTEPDIVTQAPNVDLDFTNTEKEKIYTLKAENMLDELFRLLFIKQCNKLGEILPELFEKVEDYTELLLNISYTNQDGVIRMLLNSIEEDDFKEAVEIIGWLYQYYNTELKDETFALLNKNVKITKERIPAVTQLFTPDWIVRYMVENSLGRIWIEHLQSQNKTQNKDKIDSIKSEWKYYLDEAEQDKEVELQLIHQRKSYRDLNPEDIKIIDPCMGSGHILVYAFDVFMKIYKECGYSERDAAKLIVQKNLYGLEIDDRSYQLAYFAVMMKGRKYDRRFLTRDIKPNLCSIQESNTLKTFEKGAGQLKLNDLYKETANYLISSFKNAKEYGSILNIEQRDYDGLLSYIEEIKRKGAEDLFMSLWINKISEQLPVLIKQAKIMAQKYDVVTTNPPYMGSSGMDANLSDYVKKKYPDSKSDLFAVFIEKCGTMLKENGLQAMITQHAWMFLSSFEKLRGKMLMNGIVNMAHLGSRAFEEIGGEVVQTTSWVSCKNNIKGYKAPYARLVGYHSQHTKEEAFLLKQNIHIAQQDNFFKIPGNPIAYWVSNEFINAYENGRLIGDILPVKKGMDTGNNDYFLRLWPEIQFYKTNICSKTFKWIPYNKGGSFKKWYGNNEYLLNWDNNGAELKASTANIRSQHLYFKESVTWNALSSSNICFRYSGKFSAFDSAGSSLFPVKEDIELYLGLLNTKVAQYFLNVINPTLNYGAGSIAQIPVIFPLTEKELIINLVRQNISISKTDWDSFETSWDFEMHPLLINKKDKIIEESFRKWAIFTQAQFNQLKDNEEKLNQIFINCYGLNNELTPEVEEKDVTIRKASLARDVRSFISYAVGCMFGRYSLDGDGLVYAGGEWDDSKYSTFIPDKDNILLILDEEYFEDDIVGLFIKFVKIVYGEERLEKNLEFIAQALGNRGISSKEIIRNYFVKDFFMDHLKVYQKRPIYWQFDSGKENGFKALVYMHRYDKDTVGRVRADYLHKTQAAIEGAIKSADYVIESSSNSVEKVKATKAREKYIKQHAETRVYDEAMAHIANKRIEIDLDNGVKVNYPKFQNIDVSSEGKKTQKINLLTKI